VLAPLALVGLVARSTMGRDESTAALASAACAWAAADAPFNGALPLAMVVGIGLGDAYSQDRCDDDGAASG
jgi:hypothetical protein